MALYNSNVNVCATCTFWKGNREAINHGGNLQVENETNGVCQYPMKHATICKQFYSCLFWARWPSLRDALTPGNMVLKKEVKCD